jgi:hypothetical protein
MFTKTKVSRAHEIQFSAKFLVCLFCFDFFARKFVFVSFLFRFRY